MQLDQEITSPNARASPAPSVNEESIHNLLRNLNSRLESLEMVPNHSSSLSPKLALPEKFDGNISKCKKFISSIENIFALQPARYSTANIQTRFIGSLLTGDALTWFSGVLENNPALLLDYNAFKCELKNLFDDPHAQRHACTALKRLRQGKFSVTSYSARFRHLAFQTGFNDVAKMDIFRCGLNDEVKDVLSTSLEDSEDLEALIKLAVKIDQRLHDRRLEKQSNRSFNGFSEKHRRYNPPGTQTGPAPMELDAMDGQKQKSFGKLSKEERQRRIENDLCLYCGESGHKVNKCSKRLERSLNVIDLFSASSKDHSSLTLPVNLVNQRNNEEYNALLDSGANANFISSSLITGSGMSLVKLVQPIMVRLADGSCKKVTEEVKNVKFRITNSSSGPLTFKADLMVIENLRFPVVLGTPWFVSVNPVIDWSNRRIKFERDSWSSIIYLNHVSLGDLVEKERSSNSSEDALKNREKYTHDENVGKTLGNGSYSATQGDIKEKECSSDSSKDTLTSRNNLDEVFVKYYVEFATLFEDKEVDSLPPQRTCDMEINLKDESKTPPFLKIFRLTDKEETLLKQWIDTNLEKGLIRPSKSPCAAPIFFVPKKDGTLRPCINYKLLNDNTLPDGRPLPLVSDILARFHGSCIFTCLDLKGAYNLIRIKPGNEWKAAFRSKFGLFEPLVVQFGLQNAPSVFQSFINSLFLDLLDKSVVIYLDDILIFSKTVEEHVVVVREVLERLTVNKLILKKSKCVFHTEELVYLGHVISKIGIKMDSEKTKPISEYPAPTSVRELRSFLGMTNYYRKFVHQYSELSKPLTDLTKKGKKFVWDNKAESAFKELKRAIMSDAMLRHPVLDKAFVLYTDASDFAIAAVLMQEEDSLGLCPLEYYSRKLIASELNYSVHDKELLAVKEAFEEWRHYLLYSKESTVVYCDHKNLLYFKTNRLLKPRHARWFETLMQFNFTLQHIKGTDNQLADVLSRNPRFKGHEEKTGLVLLPEKVWEATTLAVLESGDLDDHDYPEDIGEYLASPENAWICTIHPISQYKPFIKNFKLLGDRLFYCIDGLNRLYIPKDQRNDKLKMFHDNLGHLGKPSILNLLKRRFYWPNMDKDVDVYCTSCHTCQLNRPGRTSKSCYVTPIDPVALPFHRWGVDFVGRLPLTKNGNKFIFSAIDYGTRWYIGTAVKSMDENDVINSLFKEIFATFGMPFEIITDRGASFVSQNVEKFLRKYQVLHIKSTPYHPQTNGMVERVHSTLNHQLRCYLEGFVERWDEYLPQAVFNIRIRTHSTTGKSAFELLYGVPVRLPCDLEFPDVVRAPLDPLERKEALANYNSYRLSQLGQDRASAYFKSVAQANKMRRTRSVSYVFDIGHFVKMRKNQRTKFEPYWTGPYIVTELGYPGTYWLIKANGQRLDNLVNESQLAPWISQEELNNSNQKVEKKINESDSDHSNFDSDNSNSCLGDNDLASEERYMVDIPPKGDSDKDS